MPTLEARQIQVAEIDRPGTYTISQDPNQGYYSHGMGRMQWPDSYYLSGDPFTLPTRLITHLNTTFPELERLNFEAATFYEGALKPLKLEAEPTKIDCDQWRGDGGLLDLDGHITEFHGGQKLGDKNNGEKDSFNFSLQDKGSLRIVRNQLQFTESTRRNGMIRISTYGHRASEQYLGRMIGRVDITGESLGELVTEAVRCTRDFVKEQGYSVWRKPQEV